MLKSAKHVMNIDEREELLHQALGLCKNVAPNVNLPEICGQFTTLKAYQAVVDLCVTCAKKFDPEDIAVHFYKNADQNDEDAYQFYLRRMEVYKEVVAMLDHVHSTHDNTITNIAGQGQGDVTQETTGSQIVSDFKSFHINCFKCLFICRQGKLSLKYFGKMMSYCILLYMIG